MAKQRTSKPETPEVTPETLIALLKQLGVNPQLATPPAVVEAAAPEAAPEFDAKTFAIENGFKGLRSGRLYLSAEVLAAQKRVAKSGKPEVVKTTERHGVVVWKHGDVVAVQNTY